MTGLATETQPESMHSPVMAREVVASLPRPLGGMYIDCNLGDGGHTEAILSAAHGARVLGIDVDYDALRRANERLARWSRNTTLRYGNFADIADIAKRHHHRPASAALFDLGVSSMQLDTARRGFSFRHDAKLDMRFDRTSELTAYEVVNRWSEKQLERVIGELGDEPRARRVARAIVRNRRIETTRELAAVVTRALNWPARSRQHPATRTFQGLRMVVNSEAPNLERGLAGAVEALERGGRLIVISYHSIEDRLVKRFIRRASSFCSCPPRLPECVCDQTPSLSPIGGAVKPSLAEVKANPRARSAKMRVAEKI